MALLNLIYDQQFLLHVMNQSKKIIQLDNNHYNYSLVDNIILFEKNILTKI